MCPDNHCEQHQVPAGVMLLTYKPAVNMLHVLTADHVRHIGRGDMLMQLVYSTVSESKVAWCALA